MNSGNNSKLEQIISEKYAVTYLSKAELRIRNITLHFLNEQNKIDENKDSLIICTTINSKNILLMGDASSEEEKRLLDTYNLPRVDILKVGHHGSSTSSGEEFLKKIKPTISLISAGVNNKFGHPKEEVLHRLEDVSSSIYVTNKVGMVRLTLKKKIEIETKF